MIKADGKGNGRRRKRIFGDIFLLIHHTVIAFLMGSFYLVRNITRIFHGLTRLLLPDDGRESKNFMKYSR